MGKWFGAATAAAVLAVGAAGSGVAGADHTPGGYGTKTGAPCSPSGTSLELTAENHAFDKDCLAVRAGEAFTIRFDNRDSDRHNVAILPSHSSTETLFQGDILAGPRSTVYAVPNMKAGSYHFHCEIHPNLMNGTFLVAAAPSTTSSGAKPNATPSPNTSMGGDTPAAAPSATAKPADSAPRAAASASPPAAAPKAPAATARPAAPDNLPYTGPASSQLLLLMAGLALAGGGLSVLGGARRNAVSAGRTPIH